MAIGSLVPPRSPQQALLGLFQLEVVEPRSHLPLQLPITLAAKADGALLCEPRSVLLARVSTRPSSTNCGTEAAAALRQRFRQLLMD